MKKDQTEQYDYFGRYLKFLRKLRGFSIRDVAIRSGEHGESISIGYLSDCENGKFIPSVRKLIALARIYREDPSELLAVIEKNSETVDYADDDRYDDLRKRGIKAARRDEHKEAYSLFMRSVRAAYAGKNENSVRAAAGKCNAAIILRRMGKPDRAENMLKKVVGAAKENSLLHTRIFKEMGNVHLSRGHSETAKIFLEKALQTGKEEKDEELLADLYKSLAEAAMASGSYDEAEDYYKRSVKCFESSGTNNDALQARVMLARCFTKAGSPEKALTLLEKYARSLGDNGDVRGICRAGTYMVESCCELERYGDMRKKALENINLAEKYGFPDLLFINYYYLWLAARRRNAKMRERRYFRKLKGLRKHIDEFTPEVKNFNDFLFDGEPRCRSPVKF